MARGCALSRSAHRARGRHACAPDRVRAKAGEIWRASRAIRAIGSTGSCRLVRLHAFDARLKRLMEAFDAKGMVDPQTGLLTRAAFWRDLGTAMQQSAQQSVSLSVARFTFGPNMDTPRQPRHRASGQPHRAEYRFRLSGRRWRDPLYLHRHRSALRTCDLAPDSQRAQAYDAQLRRRTPQARGQYHPRHALSRPIPPRACSRASERRLSGPIDGGRTGKPHICRDGGCKTRSH